MKPTVILTIILITLFASCSSDEDNDPKYNWELKIHHKTYDKDGNPKILDASGRGADWMETIIVESKSEKEINKHLDNEYKKKLCPFCYPNQKPWPYPVWKDPNSNFYYYKEEIPDFQGPEGPLHGGPIYHERAGTLNKLN